MVQAGTIDQAQASVLDADIRKGRIDPDQLVANGTLSQAQADTVMERLGAVKRSLAPGGPAERGRSSRRAEAIAPLARPGASKRTYHAPLPPAADAC